MITDRPWYSVEGLQDIADHDQVLADGNTYTVESPQNESITARSRIPAQIIGTMSSYDVARAREQIALGVTDHTHLVQKLKDYRLRLT